MKYIVKKIYNVILLSIIIILSGANLNGQAMRCINELVNTDAYYSPNIASDLEEKGIEKKIKQKSERFNTSKITFKVKVVFVGIREEDREELSSLAQKNINELNKGFSISRIRFKLTSSFEFIADDYRNIDIFDKLGKYERRYRNNSINLFVYDKLATDYSGFSPNPYTQEKGSVHRFKRAYVHLHVDAYANESSTLIHEFGHLFGLLHTHEVWNGERENVRRSNCFTTGDFLCDTPADPNLHNEIDASQEDSNDCIYVGEAKDDYGNSYSPDVYNFMSYSYYGCRSRFTNGQVSVINRSALLWSATINTRRTTKDIVESTGRIFYDLASPIDRSIGVPTRYVLIIAVNDSVLYSKRLEEYLLFSERIRVEDLLVNNEISVVLFDDSDLYLLGRLFKNVTLSDSDGFSNSDRNKIELILNGEILKCPTFILLEVVPNEYRYKLKVFIDSYLHIENFISFFSKITNHD